MPEHDGSAPPETLHALGESAALARIFPRLPQADAALLGPGDDAAILAASDGRYVVTTDMMVHGPDFRWAWSTPTDLGWKAAASNLSDVAAMGARPTALVVAIAAPPSTPVADLECFADGLRLACDTLAPGCGVVGGDLSASDVFTITVTAFGDLEGRDPVLRSGAREGDVVAIAGDLGIAGAGLAALFSDAVDAAGRPERAALDRIAHRPEVQRQLRPLPPVAAGAEAADAGATAMLDLSDGLAIDAGRLAASSGVAIDLESARLGPDPAMALHGGEDHSLLATFSSTAAVPPAFRLIGDVRPGRGLLIDGAPYDADGWDPYSGWDGAAG
jgi:thiamine-monophosphate kinase